MEYVGPFTFNAVRFALGAITLIPLLVTKNQFFNWSENKQTNSNKNVLIYGSIAAGFALFAATSLQQNGIVFTTAGKAGFITGLYVIICSLTWIDMETENSFRYMDRGSISSFRVIFDLNESKYECYYW